MAKQVANPDRFAHRQAKERWGTCDWCGYPYPEKEITKQEGFSMCVDCYEPGGLDIGRDRERRKGSALAASIAASHKEPLHTSSDGITNAGLGVTIPIVYIVGRSGFNQYEAKPLRIWLVSGGAAVDCTAYGERLTSTALTSISASHPGITASSISFPSTSQVDFSLTAAGVPDGEYSLEFTFGTFGVSSVARKRVLVSAIDVPEA